MALTHRTLNPYRPSDIPDGSFDPSANVHPWCGHTIRVASHAAAKTLWLVNDLIVTVDDAPPTKAFFPVGQAIRLTFRHKERDVHGTVTREQGLFSGRVEYSLTIEEKLVDKGVIRTANWYFAILTFVGAIALAAAPFAFEPPVTLWNFALVVVCVVGSLTCSLATIRLLVGDLAYMLPALKHDSG